MGGLNVVLVTNEAHGGDLVDQVPRYGRNYTTDVLAMWPVPHLPVILSVKHERMQNALRCWVAEISTVQLEKVQPV